MDNFPFWRTVVVTSIASFAFLTTSLYAGLIHQPVSVTSSIGQLNAGFVPDNLRDQSGLSSGYTNGVTDFDLYIASNPTHDNAGSGTRWFSSFGTTTGNLDFDLGAMLTIESMALWNIGGNGDSNIVGFNLLGDADGDFNSGAITLLSGQSADPNTGPFNAKLPEVFTFTPTGVRFVRLQITSNNGSGIVTGASEIAFEATAVPEPSIWSFVAMVALAGWLRRRRAA